MPRLQCRDPPAPGPVRTYLGYPPFHTGFGFYSEPLYGVGSGREAGGEGGEEGGYEAGLVTRPASSVCSVG